MARRVNWWYWCFTHSRPEQGRAPREECLWMGPYATKTAATRAVDRIKAKR